MITYTSELINLAKEVFPKETELHRLLKSGDTKALDFVELRLGFNIDEDDVIRAFRNKKENKLLEIAKRSKAIRDLYQQLFFHIENYSDNKAEVGQYQDCI